MKDKKYFTRKEAADFLKISVWTLNAWYRKTHKNYIPFEKDVMGNCIYKLKDLEEFKKKNSYYIRRSRKI